MNRVLAIIVLAVAGACLPPARAGDWAEFRGPDGTGRYAGPALVTEWGPEKNVTWKTPIPGLGWSSPIVVRGKIFLTTAVPLGAGAKPDHSLRAVCLDPLSGSIVWDKEVFVEDGQTASTPHKKNSHASATPVSDGERVFVHYGHMGTACLDFTGNIVWKTQEHTYKPMHGNGGSPILVGDLLVFSADGGDKQFVAALDKKTGAVKWKTPRTGVSGFGFSFSTPTAITTGGRTVIVSPASGFVGAYDPADGSEVWRVKYPQGGFSVIPRPVLAGGRVVVSSGFMSANLIAFTPPGSGETTGTVAWASKKGGPNTPTPLADGDELYSLGDNGILPCLDAKTGDVHWAERLRGNAYSASPILANGLIYVTGEDGTGQVIKTGKEFQLVSTSTMNEKTFATLVPVDGALYIRTETTLYRFDKK
jgi:outer membrane protein assembly factor BamB